MAKPNFPEKQTAPPPAWGTWEELLLACAVNRHGTTSWDSVAAELRKRATATASSLFLLLTPLSCKQKFHDLRQRFSKNDAVSPKNDDAAEDERPLASIPFLDELKRLRVDELRRELQRYDLSIVSLETKVEKLKEEREQSLKRIDERETKPDLEREEEERNGNVEILKPENESPENKVPGEGSVNDQRSENESNSSDLKNEGPKTADKESDRSEPVSGEKPPENSYDGSSDTTAKGSTAVAPVEETEKAEPERLGRVGGDGDSAESKGGLGRVEEEEEDGTKEVCSRESLSRKKVDEGEPDEPEDRSVETKRVHRDIESQPLIRFLEILRSHKSGSFFERRLEIQETRSYNNMIRQHTDFETIGTRLEEGQYSSRKGEFFRDLMLVFGNAAVFFGGKAAESAAAAELRSLVRSEMAAPTVTAEKRDSPPMEDPPEAGPKEEPSPAPASLMRKPKISVPMNACRKRSSIASRTVSTTTTTTTTTTSALSWKQSDKSESIYCEEDGPAAKNGSRASARNKGSSKKDSSPSRSSPALASAPPPPKSEKENVAGAKKRSAAAGFLSRMKRGSPPAEVAEQRKRKERVTPPPPPPPPPATRRVSSGKQTKESEESPAKKNAGRPAKRSAAAAALGSAPLPTKRSRQGAEAEVVGPPPPRNAKKRSRK